MCRLMDPSLVITMNPALGMGGMGSMDMDVGGIGIDIQYLISQGIDPNVPTCLLAYVYVLFFCSSHSARFFVCAIVCLRAVRMSASVCAHLCVRFYGCARVYMCVRVLPTRAVRVCVLISIYKSTCLFSLFRFVLRCSCLLRYK